MSWIQLSIQVKAAQAEVVSEVCMAQGALAVTFQDAHDQPILEPLLGEFPLWQESEIIALYDIQTDMNVVLSHLQQQLPAELLSSIQLAPLAERDWVRDVRANVVPLQFGERLWICPSWHTVPQADAVTVLLDPGLAFGTGTHPTTALCLAWLAAKPLAGKSVIDFGCGSGILAIAALKLGATSAVGIDVDPQALEASRDNAQRNGVSDRLTLHLADEPPVNMTADVVVANILAEPLKHLAVPISGLVSVGGDLVLSGILTTQAEDVMAAYNHHFTFELPCQSEEWCRISGVARSPRAVKMVTRINDDSFDSDVA